ncbi:MAG: oxidoreductase [Cyanobacteria bacterium PR.3.49]|nr:oxidoreductase [Cyanobacteria bacterium PR.3.49]
MSNSNLRIALMGFGLAGEIFHAPILKVTDGLEVTVITSSDSTRQKKAATVFPKAEIVDSFDTAIKSHKEKFDLAVIVSPNKWHAPQAKAALEAGKSVVVDKPFAVNSRECRELIETAQKHKQLLTVYQNRRWDNDFLTLQKLLKDNVLQDVVRFESRFERFRNKIDTKKWREVVGTDEGGGLLFDLGSHLIDQACVLFGTPTTIYCELDKRRDGVRADDDAFVALEFESGVRAHLHANMVSAIPGPRFRLLAMNGGYEKFGLDPQEDALRAGLTPKEKNWGIESASLSGKLAIERNGKMVTESLVCEKGNYQLFYIALRDAIANNTPAPVDPEDALKTISIIEHARQSSQLGRKLEFQSLVVSR